MPTPGTLTVMPVDPYHASDRRNSSTPNPFLNRAPVARRLNSRHLLRSTMQMAPPSVRYASPMLTSIHETLMFRTTLLPLPTRDSHLKRSPRAVIYNRPTLCESCSIDVEDDEILTNDDFVALWAFDGHSHSPEPMRSRSALSTQERDFQLSFLGNMDCAQITCVKCCSGWVSIDGKAV